MSWNVELEVGSEARSRAGSGRAFSCASAATRSTLTSNHINDMSWEKAPMGVFGVPLPDWAKAASARATKNSRRDTRGLELTRLTICCTLFAMSVIEHKYSETHLVYSRRGKG